MNLPRAAVTRLSTGELIEKDLKGHQTRVVAIDPNTCQILQARRRRQETIARTFRTQLDPDGYIIADLATDPTGMTSISPDRLS